MSHPSWGKEGGNFMQCFVEKQLKKIKNIRSWFAIESATKYGVGVEDQSHTMHVLPKDAKLKSKLPLHAGCDYGIQKFMDGIMDKQCDKNGGTWTNNGQVTTIWQQDIWGASNNESIMSLFRSLLSLQ